MRLVGRGHPAIRATHAKTLEFAGDPQITERATCIVAVALEAPAGEHAPAPMAGPVRITIEVRDESFALDAAANSAWEPTGQYVVRRGPLRLPGTLAINATASAADLPRALVSALRDPSATVRITVDPRPGPPTVVLFAADPLGTGRHRLAAELAAADAIIVEDDGARALVRAAGGHPSADDRPTGRVLVVAAEDVPGRSIEVGQRAVEVVGLPAWLAAAASLPGHAPITHAAGRDARTALQRTPAAHRLVLGTDRRSLGELLDLAAGIRGSTHAAVAQAYRDPVLVEIADRAAVDFAGADRLWIAVGPSDASGLDPGVRDAVLGLLADGIATKPAARALAALTGWPLRRAYDTVLAMSPPR